MTEQDITAFRAAPAPTAAPVAQPRRVWPWVLLALLALALLAAAALSSLLLAVDDWAGPATTITIDGETVSLGDWHAGGGLLAFAGVLLALLLVLCIVPVAVALALAAAAVGIGIALVAVLAVCAVVLSPLILIGVLLWWALRPKRPAAPVS